VTSLPAPKEWFGLRQADLAHARGPTFRLFLPHPPPSGRLRAVFHPDPQSADFGWTPFLVREIENAEFFDLSAHSHQSPGLITRGTSRLMRGQGSQAQPS
jgi:hypothetical protein